MNGIHPISVPNICQSLTLCCIQQWEIPSESTWLPAYYIFPTWMLFWSEFLRLQWACEYFIGAQHIRCEETNLFRIWPSDISTINTISSTQSPLPSGQCYLAHWLYQCKKTKIDQKFLFTLICLIEVILIICIQNSNDLSCMDYSRSPEKFLNISNNHIKLKL